MGCVVERCTRDLITTVVVTGPDSDAGVPRKRALGRRRLDTVGDPLLEVVALMVEDRRSARARDPRAGDVSRPRPRSSSSSASVAHQRGGPSYWDNHQRRRPPHVDV